MTRALSLLMLAAVSACVDAPVFNPPPPPTGSAERVELALDGARVTLELRPPETPLVSAGARFVVVDAQGVEHDSPIPDGHDCLRVGPVMVDGTAQADAWAVSHGCHALQVTVAFHGALWDVRGTSADAAEVWSVSRTPVLQQHVALRRSLLPRNTLRRAGSPPQRWIEASVAGDAAFAALHATPELALTNALAIVAVANGLLRDGGLTPQLGMVITRFTLFRTDPYTPTTVGTETNVNSLLSLFDTWAAANAGPRDAAALLSGQNFSGSTVGLAAVGGMCRASSGSLITQVTFNSTPYHGSALAHETGHLLGMSHDSSGNVCDSSGFVMASTGCTNCGNQPTQFSPCSDAALDAWLAGGNGACLGVVPPTGVQPVCGDGLPGPDEQCDCGTWCDQDPCCNGATCQWAAGGECSALDACCTQCQFTQAGQSCAAPSGPCDLGGTCSGTASTCFTTLRPAGLVCNDGINATGGRCLDGDCHSLTSQCAAQEANYPFMSPLVACASQATFGACGTLYCGVNGNPTQCVSFNSGGGAQAVEPGTACGAQNLCENSMCVATSTIMQDTCPNDPAKTEPGVCGCGQPDADSDGDGALDCLDACPLHPDEQTAPCSTHRWVTGSWSQCGAECNGVQTRAVVCQAVTGGIVAAAFCSAQPQPAGTRVCNPCGWVTGSWSQCSAECNGVQTRSVVCQSASGMPMPATGCANEPAPAASMVCNVCTFEWVAAGWSACSLQCDGVQIRAVTCMGSNQQPADASQCTEPAPLSQQACNPCSYTWASGTWSTCSAECDGTRTRSVLSLIHI